jgi:hypothetical protein
MKVFDESKGTLVYTNGFRLNCHICGKSYAPLSVYNYFTDKKDYYLGTYCRLVLVIFPVEYEWNRLCDCLKKQAKHVTMFRLEETREFPYIYTWVYDPKDDMEGKVIAK